MYWRCEVNQLSYNSKIYATYFTQPITNILYHLDVVDMNTLIWLWLIASNYLIEYKTTVRIFVVVTCLLPVTPVK